MLPCTPSGRPPLATFIYRLQFTISPKRRDTRVVHYLTSYHRFMTFTLQESMSRHHTSWACNNKEHAYLKPYLQFAYKIVLNFRSRTLFRWYKRRHWSDIAGYTPRYYQYQKRHIPWFNFLKFVIKYSSKFY
jgi:hypothetical protein